MEFTYKAYTKLIDLLKKHNYSFTDYSDFGLTDKSVILRHDVDYDLHRVLKMAELEKEQGVSSTYFVLATSDFYNIMSKESQEILHKLQNLGHRIGLHFDEKRYDFTEENWNGDKIKELIKYEAGILSKMAGGGAITAVSMHRPSKSTLESDLQIDGMANSYSKKFFTEFKYLSDSRMRWRENAEEIIVSEDYSRIQLLTHPFWYFEEPRPMKDIIADFIYARGDVAKYRYEIFDNNFSRLEEVLTPDL